jgi:hypothetical protein
VYGDFRAVHWHGPRAVKDHPVRWLCLAYAA